MRQQENEKAPKTKMTVIADKVLVVFLDGALSPGDSAAAAAESKAFNEVAARGCNGFLVLPGAKTLVLKEEIPMFYVAWACCLVMNCLCATLDHAQGNGELSDLENLLSVERVGETAQFKYVCASIHSIAIARTANTQ